jgi:hypothetical protein
MGLREEHISLKTEDLAGMKSIRLFLITDRHQYNPVAADLGFDGDSQGTYADLIRQRSAGNFHDREEQLSGDIYIRDMEST